MLARFRAFDQRLAKAAFYTARSSLLSAHRTMLKANKDRWFKPTLDKASKSLLKPFNTPDNLALERWIKFFKTKAVKEMFFASKFYMKNLGSLPESDEFNNVTLGQIKLAKDKFLNELNSIHFNEFEEIYNERKAKIDVIKSKNKISEAEAVQLANVLTNVLKKKFKLVTLEF